MPRRFRLSVTGATYHVYCRVARGFNHRRGYLGRLWQSRYRARIIASQVYLRQLLSYVHLNPVAAEIVSDPANCPYGGYREISATARDNASARSVSAKGGTLTLNYRHPIGRGRPASR